MAKLIAKKTEKTNNNRRDALQFSDSYEVTCLYEEIAQNLGGDLSEYSVRG